MPNVTSRNPSVAGGDWLGWAGIQPASVQHLSSTVYVIVLDDGTRLNLFGSNLSGEVPGPTSGEVTGFSWTTGDGVMLVGANGFSVDAATLSGWPAAAIASAFRAAAQGGIAIEGHEGPDRLVGGDGADDLAGGAGGDTLVGGAGDDVFRYGEADGSDLAGEGAVHGSAADGSGGAGETDAIHLAGSAAYDLRGIAITQIDRIAVRNDVPVQLRFDAAQFGAGLVSQALVLEGLPGAASAAIDASVTVDMPTAGAFTAAGWAIAPGGALHLQVNGSAGADTIAGSGFDDALVGGGGADAINGGGGADRIALSQVAGAIDGGAGRDSLAIDLSGSAAGLFLTVRAPTLTTRTGALSFTGIENVHVSAGSGRDVLAGAEGDDEFAGGGGNDRLLGGVGGDLLDGGAHSDDLRGEAGRDGLRGGDGGDVLDGGTGLDTLEGGAGDDTLHSRLGEAADTGGSNPFGPVTSREHLDGGAGIDLALIDRSTAARGFAVDLGDPAHPIGLGDGTTLVNVERIVFRAGLGSDTVGGGAFADDIAGGDGRDVLSGAGGIDILDGAAGMDLRDGGADADRLAGGTGLDMLDGGEGNDRLSGGDGFDTLDGGAGADMLDGDAGLDWLDGGAGDDLLRGGSGADTLAGGLGNDRYEIDGPDDRVFEEAGEGRDTVSSTVDHVLAANVEALILAGSAASGGGNAGDNSLTGNALANTLAGGAGNDSFVFRGAFGIDTVTDFVAGARSADRLYVERPAFATREAALAAAQQNGADVWIVVDAATRVVLADTDLARLHVDDFVLL